MNQPKNNWATNIRHLRKRKKLSQEVLAEVLGISRSKLNAHENGQTTNPTAEDLIKFSEYFNISIDTLLKIDLAKLPELKLRELEAGNDAYVTGAQIRVLAITVDRKEQENLEYVPIKAKAGYRGGYNDPEYIASLPGFRLPNLPRGKTCRMFPSTGDSMLPIPEDADIIAEYLQDWKSIKADTPCIVILKSEGQGADFVFKLVTYQADNRSFSLRSMNDLYAPYTVAFCDVLEIWKYHSYHSRKLPAPDGGMRQLTAMIKALQTDIRKLKDQ